MKSTKSQRYLHALQQLPQFVANQPEPENCATHILTGVVVYAFSDKRYEEYEMLKLRFTRGHEIEVLADLYFRLQLAEAAAHDLHSFGTGTGPIADRAEELHKQLSSKYKL